MIEIYCTAPLVKRFDLELDTPDQDNSSNALGAWYATVLNVQNLRLVVWLNEASNLTLVTRARRAEFPSQFSSALETLLIRIGIPEPLAAKERHESSEFRFVKARDRSLLGSLRDAMLRTRWDLERGLDLEEIEDHMAEMPARAKAFLFPREVVFSRFGLSRPRVTSAGQGRIDV